MFLMHWIITPKSASASCANLELFLLEQWIKNMLAFSISATGFEPYKANCFWLLSRCLNGAKIQVHPTANILRWDPPAKKCKIQRHDQTRPYTRVLKWEKAMKETIAGSVFQLVLLDCFQGEKSTFKGTYAMHIQSLVFTSPNTTMYLVEVSLSLDIYI